MGLKTSKEEIKLLKRFARQESALWPPRDLWRPVVIVGVGAVGSLTTYALASMGCKNIIVYDHDNVEIHNTAYSFYPEKFAGKRKKTKKVAALKQIIKYFKKDEISLEIHDQKFSNQLLPKNCIVVIAVDNMDTRAEIWRGRIKKNPDVFLYLEARMSFDTYRLYTIRPGEKEDIAVYEKSLYSQKEAYQETCGQRSIIFTPMGVAAEIAANIKKFVKGEYVSREIIREYLMGTLISKKWID